MSATNAFDVAADLVKLGAETATKVHEVVVVHTALLEASVKRHANEARTNPRPRAPGSPEGPRLLTGAYNRSIGRRITTTPDATIGEVGTDAPQGRRLEMGFYGADSIGRNYRQLSYPHFGPAMDEIQPVFDAAVAAAANPMLP